MKMLYSDKGTNKEVILSNQNNSRRVDIQITDDKDKNKR